LEEQMQTKRPCVLFDRDGTINEDVGYLDRLERLVLYPACIDAVRLLNRAGFLTAVITNQAGVAHGLYGEGFVQELHQHIAARFEAGGARIDGFFYCPHSPEAALVAYRRQCDCRKPRPGLVRQAERALNLDLQRSVVVGDRWRDVETGLAVGASTVLVRTGYGRTEELRPPDGVAADVVVDNIMDAAVWILLRERARREERADAR
jgi:D-glycero-D-manno-heptose 1,7-bisphosphate phosphatase